MLENRLISNGPVYWDPTSLAAGNNYIYLVYHRIPINDLGDSYFSTETPQLYIDIFEWDPLNKTVITPTDMGSEPIRIPIEEDDLGFPALGFYLWAGWDSGLNKLVLIIQSIHTKTHYGWVPDREITPTFDLEKIPQEFREIIPPERIPPNINPLYSDKNQFPQGLDDEILLGQGVVYDDDFLRQQLPKIILIPGPLGPRRIPLPSDPSIVNKRSGGFIEPPKISKGKPYIYSLDKPNLVMLTSDGATVDLSVDSNWKSKIIDEGGYDFDVWFDQLTVHIVYRRKPYSTVIEGDPYSGNSDISFSSQEEYPNIIFNPLFYRVVSVEPLDINTSRSIDLIPGGDHPQIQMLAPLTITADRAEEGKMVLREIPGEFIRLVNPELTRTAKVRLEHNPSEDPKWRINQLFTMDPLFQTRGNEMHQLSSFTALAAGSKLKYSSLLIPRPVYQVGALITTEEGLESKVSQFTLLMQVLRNDVLGELNARGFLGRIGFELDGSNSNIKKWKVEDHSHLQIDYADWPREDTTIHISFGLDQIPLTDDIKGPLGSENLQFEPLDYNWFDSIKGLANTVGACLTVEDRRSPLSFYAYTDAGDGGLRVIFNDTGQLPDDLVDISKDPVINASEVSGTGLGNITIATITGSGWIPSDLPHYLAQMDKNGIPYSGLNASGRVEPVSLGAGIHPLYDTFIPLAAALGAGPTDPPSVNLNQNVVDSLQSTLILLSQTQDPILFFSGGDPDSRFEVNDTILWSNQTFDLDGSISMGTRFSVKTYQWQFEKNLAWDGEDWVGEIFTLLFLDLDNAILNDVFLPSNDILPSTDLFRITLTVGNDNGESVHSIPAEITRGNMPGRPIHLVGASLSTTNLEISLEWQIPTDVASANVSYKVYRSLATGSASPVFIANSPDEFYNDDVGLSQNNRYRYWVSAVVNNIEGPLSSPTEVLVKSYNSAPRNLIALHTGDRVELRWGNPPLPADITPIGFMIYRRLHYESDYELIANVNVWGRFFEDRNVSREEGVNYIVAANLLDGTVPVLGSWSEPVLAHFINEAVPTFLSVSESSGNIQLDWIAPDPTVDIAGYKVYRAELYGVAGYQDLTPNPIITNTFIDVNATLDKTWIYVVVAINGQPETSQAEGFFVVNEVWDAFWDMHANMNRNDDFRIHDSELDFGKYNMTFNVDNPNPLVFENQPVYSNREIFLETHPQWNTFFKIRDGTIDYKIPIKMRSKDIEIINSLIVQFINVNSLNVDIDYIRPYTLGVLMRDERSIDLQSRELAIIPDDALRIDRNTPNERRLASALSAKPMGESRIEIPRINVEISLTRWGRLVEGLLILTLFFGLVALWHWLKIKQLELLNPLTMAAAAAAILFAATTTVEPLIETAAESRIKDELTRTGIGSFKSELDESPLMWFAGEGLSEAIARKILTHQDIGLTPDPSGRDRYREQFWQKAIVESGKISIWVNM